MKFKVLMLLSLMMLINSGLLLAKHSDSFLLGNYSYLRGRDYNYAFIDTVSNRMKQTGYNATVCEIFNSSTDNDIRRLLSTLNSDSIDAILIDNSWEEGSATPTYGMEALSIGNYWRFEAEYDSSFTFNPNVDRFFYINSNKTGSEIEENSASERYIRTLDNDNPGYALNTLEFRWTSDYYDSLGCRQVRYKIGPEVRFVQRCYETATGGDDFNANPCSDDTLFVTIAFKCSDLPTTPNTDLIRFSFNGDASGIDINDFRNVNHFNPVTNTYGLDSFVTVADYNSLPVISGNGIWAHKEITLGVSVRDMYNAGLIEHALGWRYSLVNLNPQMYWYGRGKLEVDYVEIEDTMHRNLKNNPTLRDSVRSRINHLAGIGDNIKYLYLSDEPTVGQFDQYKEMSDNLFASQPLPSSISGVLTCSWLFRRMTEKNNGKIFGNIPLFKEIANPEVLMFDIYPIKKDLRWNIAGYENAPNNQFGVQKRLDQDMLDYYLEYRRMCKENNVDFIPVPQTYGVWDNVASKWGSDIPENDEFGRWGLMRPPRNMQKCLQLLPLCYGANGIVDFKLYNTGSTEGDEYCLFNRVGSTLTPNNNWYGIVEANDKIAKYMNMDNIGVSHSLAINPDDWFDAQVINCNGYANSDTLQLVLLDSLYVRPVVEAGISFDLYDGYVQCGLFRKSVDNQPYFMMVNRRTEFRNSTIDDDVLMSFGPIVYDSSYTAAPPQTVRFKTSTQANTMYGDYIALYDPYDNGLFYSTNGGIDVPIGPGDGKLLQMCSSLPALVNSNHTLKKIAYLSDSIVIENGVTVEIAAGTKTRIFPNTTIRVRGGSTLKLAGEIAIGDSVHIIVEQGSKIDFDNADCVWGNYADLSVDDSEFCVTESSFSKTLGSDYWNGFYVLNSENVHISDSQISGAFFNSIYDSDVVIENSVFNVPENAIGLWINNSSAGSTSITATADSMGFYGTGGTTYGLFIEDSGSNLYLNNIVFHDNGLGLYLYNATSEQDTISYCRFYDNEIGVQLSGSLYNPVVSDCEFNSSTLGMYLEAASPVVNDCSFVDCETGICMEQSSLASGLVQSCSFTGGEVGIESRSSTLRIEQNEFITGLGIVNHSGSALRIGYDAHNKFTCSSANLRFKDTVSYTAQVQLICGHNDFYHQYENGTPVSEDFHFDSNWIVGYPRSNAIHVDYNWFDNDNVIVGCPGTQSDYITYSTLDRDPNVVSKNYNRMISATEDEINGNMQSANLKFKEILDDNLDEESKFHIDALDGYYRTYLEMGGSQGAIQDYLADIYTDYAVSSPIVAQFIDDYLVKVPLAYNDFQTSINKLQLRLENPACEIDSLMAVMDLEIVLHLAEKQPTKAMLNTMYKEYQYPDNQTFVAKHQDHWVQLRRLFNKSEDIEIPAPPVAIIASNYPNPFNPSTTIKYGIPADAKVKICVYNIKGQKVRELLNTDMPKGYHSIVWDGKDGGGRSVSSGIYFFRLDSAGKSSVRKAMLMK